jgi:pilus assembly protein FimV
MKALEATLAALREQSAQNQRLLLEMRSELAEARDSRYRNPLVYALCLLLLLALIGLFMLWRVARRTTGPAWWGETTGKDDDGPSLRSTGVALSAGLVGASVAESSPVPKTGPFGTPLLAADTEDDAPDTLPLLVEDESAPARYVNTEELFDVQQQSDFFLSLGQHEQAIAVLSEHIADNPETSALAYLDLLRIYHALDRRDDYARVGQEFERAFNASVPDFEQFSEVGHGLEHYRSTLARIEAQWPRQGTLALIEELVFRKPGTRGDESFDLAAYRELLLLYSVAKEVIDPDSAPPTPVTPLSFLDTHEAKLEPTRPADLDRATEQLGLTGSDHNAPDAPLPSLYGAIDETLSHDTVIAAHPGAASARPAASASTSSHVEEPQTRPMSVNERQERPDQSAAMAFDNTSLETLETLPAELELEKRPSSPPTTDDMPLPELRLDLELFDPTIEAEIAPRPRRRR